MPDLLLAAPGDAELVRAAQAGDVAGLGLLLDRYRGDLRAVALAVLGHCQDAEDAVQDAMILALRRIGELRDPEAVGPWLRAVVRNACYAQRRRRSAVLVDDAALAGIGCGEPDPAELLDRHALRDWVWVALEGLTPTLRLVTLLRYFTDVTAYEDIAALCGIPVGTVRSRLSQARTKLADSLAACAEDGHQDVRAFTASHRAVGHDLMAAAYRGNAGPVLAQHWSPEARVLWPSGRYTDRDYLIGALGRDLGAGVRHELRNVVAGRDVVIWEDTLISPPEDPEHCPPSVVWVHFLAGARVDRVRLYHPRRRAEK